MVAQSVKNLPAVQEICVRSMGQEDPLEKEMANHSGILTLKIPWTKESGRLQSMDHKSQIQPSDQTTRAIDNICAISCELSYRYWNPHKVEKLTTCWPDCSHHRKWKLKLLSRVRLFETPWVMGYTVDEILQARILEWVTFPFSRGSFQPRDRTQVFCIAGGFFTSWATREAQEYWNG